MFLFNAPCPTLCIMHVGKVLLAPYSLYFKLLSPYLASHGPPMTRPLEPMFHTVPPRPQRLLPPAAYIRYLEGLASDSQTMSNWGRRLHASRERTTTGEA